MSRRSRRKAAIDGEKKRKETNTRCEMETIIEQKYFFKINSFSAKAPCDLCKCGTSTDHLKYKVEWDDSRGLYIDKFNALMKSYKKEIASTRGALIMGSGKVIYGISWHPTWTCEKNLVGNKLFLDSLKAAE